MNGLSVTLSRKFVDLLRGRYSGLQILQRINRTPLRHVVKAALTLAYVREKRRRRAFARSLAPETAMSELRKQGIARPTVDQALLKELSDTAMALWHRAGERHRRFNKGFLKALLAEDLNAGRVENSSIFVRFALQPAIVDTVAGYFREMPYLSYVALDVSEHLSGRLQTSQLWHRDYDDTTVVKLFVYLTDVLDVADGPFTFIPPGPSSRVRGAAAAAHLDDAIVFRHVSTAAIVRMRAPRATAFLVDTGRCYHMGSRVSPGHARLMFTACYITQPAIYPNFRNKIRILGELDARQRLVLLP